MQPLIWRHHGFKPSKLSARSKAFLFLKDLLFYCGRTKSLWPNTTASSIAALWLVEDPSTSRRAHLHCGSGQELSEEQFAYRESLLVPSSEQDSSCSSWLKRCPQCLSMYLVILGTIAPGTMPGSFVRGSFATSSLWAMRCHSMALLIAEIPTSSSGHITLSMKYLLHANRVKRRREHRDLHGAEWEQISTQQTAVGIKCSTAHGLYSQSNSDYRTFAWEQPVVWGRWVQANLSSCQQPMNIST